MLKPPDVYEPERSLEIGFEEKIEQKNSWNSIYDLETNKDFAVLVSSDSTMCEYYYWGLNC